MIFSSTTFLIFLAAILALYGASNTVRQRAALLLVGSLIFYASWKPIYLLLLVSSLAINYLFYIRLLETRLRIYLVVGIVANLVVLGLFKYLSFFLENLLTVGHWLALVATPQVPTWIDWALPLGISFFTFQMVGVHIDVYRGQWQRRVDFWEWCLFVSYFPQFIAGPIVRAHELFDQLEHLQPLRGDNLRLGALIFAGGLFKKALLADNIAPIVEGLYGQPENLDFVLAWFATVAFSFQIYFDFSGYSEMAVGLGRMMGIELPRNFLYPYWARNFSDFWRRWHITLSQWLRDYLYIGLGGSHGSRSRTFFNLMTTMFLGGLWHGAGWTFVVWGLLHGFYLVGHRLLVNLYEAAFGIERRPVMVAILAALGIPLTYALTCLTWVFFRADSFADAWQVAGTMLGIESTTGQLPTLRLYEIIIVATGGLVVLIEPWLVACAIRTRLAGWWYVPFPIRGLVYASFALAVIVFGGATQKFIYFDF